jgi:hypothetical protein
MIKVHANSLQGGEPLIKQSATERVTGNVEGEAELGANRQMVRSSREGGHAIQEPLQFAHPVYSASLLSLVCNLAGNSNRMD